MIFIIIFLIIFFFILSKYFLTYFIDSTARGLFIKSTPYTFIKPSERITEISTLLGEKQSWTLNNEAISLS